mmetsp:Transcript_2153/g.2330  ORF Transcript_2153/g.2330 Transcript_2153/m.2330 type:complete len:461 (+) Transcript_2153:91-1473(+)
MVKKATSSSRDEQSSSASSSDDEQGLEAMERMLSDGSESDDDSGDSDSDVEADGDDNSNGSDDEDVGEDDNLPTTDTSDEQVGQEDYREDNDVMMNGEENCTLDLRNLLAMNSHQVNYRALYQEKNSDDGALTINTIGFQKADENHLLEKATDGCSQLLKGLWELETEKTDAGPLAVLPSYFVNKTPRELPPPKQKAETKWDKFAKEKGIAVKEKRSRKVWDEASQTWSYLTGYQKSADADNPESWPIMEVKGNENPYDDPWERARDTKKERVDKNVMSRMKNEERAGNLVKGTTGRTMKAKKAMREDGRQGGKQGTTAPAGIAIDMKSGTQRGKELTKAALLATQRSTASLGKFDQIRDGEPERRKAMMLGLKKRKFESGTDKNVIKSEAKKNMKVLENVLAGGGKAKERAIRRGDLSKGETAYDYDYSDGLGAGTYKKKKGRAGMGKLKKITKKRAKG